MHYRPRTLVLNNLEFDHADIFPDLAAIERQFHHLVRTVPGNGLIVSNGGDDNLERVLGVGCWTPVVRFGDGQAWQAVADADDAGAFAVQADGVTVARVAWEHGGVHMVENALAAIAAARHAGIPPAQAAEALSAFSGVRRRMELRGTERGISVWDDFAHHPTAIRVTIDGLRRRAGGARIVAVVDPRSNTMRMGSHREALAAALGGADLVALHAPASLEWDADATVATLGEKAWTAPDPDAIVERLAPELRTGDQVVVMSNGAFGALHDKLLAALRAATDQR